MAQRLGAAAFVVKPFELAEIVRRGRSLIGPTHEGRAIGVMALSIILLIVFKPGD